MYHPRLSHSRHILLLVAVEGEVVTFPFFCLLRLLQIQSLLPLLLDFYFTSLYLMSNNAFLSNFRLGVNKRKGSGGHGNVSGRSQQTILICYTSRRRITSQFRLNGGRVVCCFGVLREGASLLSDSSFSLVSESVSLFITLAQRR